MKRNKLINGHYPKEDITPVFSSVLLSDHVKEVIIHGIFIISSV